MGKKAFSKAVCLRLFEVIRELPGSSFILFAANVSTVTGMLSLPSGGTALVFACNAKYTSDRLQD